MSQNHPSHRNEPDAVQAMKDFRILLGRGLEKTSGVPESAEAEQERFWKWIKKSPINILSEFFNEKRCLLELR